MTNLQGISVGRIDSCDGWQGLVRSVRKRPGRPADNRQVFSPASPGQSETDLGFSGQALGIFLITGHYFVQGWLTSTDI